MLYTILTLILAVFAPCLGLLSLEKLSEKYLVSYGNPNAPVKIVEYFSFQCPHCLALFRKDFKKIEEKYIDTQKVYWVFHPIPSDLTTVQGMVCLANLNELQKKLYLETMLEEAELNQPQVTALIMIKVMEIFKMPISNLNDENFLQKTDAFLDAFDFLVQDEKILAVPTIEVDSKLFKNEVPDFEFVQSIVKEKVL
jgi:hypothetical protein